MIGSGNEPAQRSDIETMKLLTQWLKEGRRLADERAVARTREEIFLIREKFARLHGLLQTESNGRPAGRMRRMISLNAEEMRDLDQDFGHGDQQV